MGDPHYSPRILIVLHSNIMTLAKVTHEVKGPLSLMAPQSAGEENGAWMASQFLSFGSGKAKKLHWLLCVSLSCLKGGISELLPRKSYFRLCRSSGLCYTLTLLF